MANHKFKITNERDYNSLMKTIDALMKKGGKKLTDKEAEDLREMALAAQSYERNIYTITTPKA